MSEDLPENRSVEARLPCFTQVVTPLSICSTFIQQILIVGVPGASGSLCEQNHTCWPSCATIALGYCSTGAAVHN